MKDQDKILNEAESYTRMVTNSFAKKKFDNKFLLNLVTMSLEKYMVAYLMSKNNLPNGHTLSFLSNEVAKYTTLPLRDMELMQTLDEKIQLCALEHVAPYHPDDKEMEDILQTLNSVQSLVKEAIKTD